MPTKTIAAVGAALILFAIATSANARTVPSSQPAFDRHTGGYSYEPAAVKVVRHVKAKRGKPRHYRERPAIPKNYAARTERTAQIVDHPIGCPHRAFCGCGTALYLLGKRVTEGGLAIAKNWLDFPRVACAANMAAARPGHVFAIIECLSGNRALAYDPNSGGHQTRIHVRDLSRYAIVNPHGGSRYAQAP